MVKKSMIKKIKNNPVSFRLSKEKHTLYEIEAAKKGMGLGIYLKQKLEKRENKDENVKSSPFSVLNEDQLIHLIPLMQKTIQFIEKNDKEVNQYRGMMLEILLLLRCTVQPHKVNMVQAELERRGLEIWTSDSWGKVMEKGKDDDR